MSKCRAPRLQPATRFPNARQRFRALTARKPRVQTQNWREGFKPSPLPDLPQGTDGRVTLGWAARPRGPQRQRSCWAAPSRVLTWISQCSVSPKKGHPMEPLGSGRALARSRLRLQRRAQRWRAATSRSPAAAAAASATSSQASASPEPPDGCASWPALAAGRREKDSAGGGGGRREGHLSPLPFHRLEGGGCVSDGAARNPGSFLS